MNKEKFSCTEITSPTDNRKAERRHLQQQQQQQQQPYRTMANMNAQVVRQYTENVVQGITTGKTRDISLPELLEDAHSSNAQNNQKLAIVK
jgi:hypothetical protein